MPNDPFLCYFAGRRLLPKQCLIQSCADSCLQLIFHFFEVNELCKLRRINKKFLTTLENAECWKYAELKIDPKQFSLIPESSLRSLHSISFFRCDTSIWNSDFQDEFSKNNFQSINSFVIYHH